LVAGGGGCMHAIFSTSPANPRCKEYILEQGDCDKQIDKRHGFPRRWLACAMQHTCLREQRAVRVAAGGTIQAMPRRRFSLMVWVQPGMTSARWANPGQPRTAAVTSA